LNQYFIYSMRARIKKIKLLHQEESYFIILTNILFYQTNVWTSLRKIIKLFGKETISYKHYTRGAKYFV